MDFCIEISSILLITTSTSFLDLLVISENKPSSDKVVSKQRDGGDWFSHDAPAKTASPKSTPNKKGMFRECASPSLNIHDIDVTYVYLITDQVKFKPNQKIPSKKLVACSTYFDFRKFFHGNLEHENHHIVISRIITQAIIQFSKL